MHCELNRASLMIVLIVAALAGCKVGPNFHIPCTDAPETWNQAAAPVLQGAPADLCTWWRSFNDPNLDLLVDTALQGNPELKEAGKRILEARALRGVAAGYLYPQQQALNANYNNLRISGNTANFVTVPGFFETDRVFDNWNTNFGLAWELDFWGRLRRTVEVADAQVCQSVAGYDFVQSLLLAELAKNYIEMRAIESRIAITNELLEIQRLLVDLSEKRLNEGTGTKLDVQQAKANLYLVEYELPGLEILRLQACHRICVLTGSMPMDLKDALGNTGQVPAPSEAVAIGIPADLLRRRPDIQIAEKELAAQCAKIGIAQAEFYPHISLTGQIGLQSQNLSDLFQTRSMIGSVGPGLSWNLLNYGRIKCKVAAEREAFDRLFYAYQKTVLNAYQEAEDSHAIFVQNFARQNAILLASQATYEATLIGVAAHREGSADLFRILQLQKDHLRASTELATVRGDVAKGMVKFYLAMGGGWSESMRTATICSTPSHVPCR